MSPCPRLLALLLALTAPAVAQYPYEKDEAKLNQSAAARLNTFARDAQRLEVFSRAKEAYDLILDYYDPDHNAARRALGYTKVKGEWKEPERVKLWPDDSNDEKRWKVVAKWRDVADAIGKLHRELGIKAIETHPVQGDFHLQRAIWFNPFDEAAHQALGHVQFEGFWGTEEEVAFVKRLREIERHAIELARKDYEVEPVTELPPQLQRMVDEDADLEFHGAKSKTFTIFTRGTQKNADDCVKWAERATDFLHFCLPTELRKKADLRRFFAEQFDWTGFLWTRSEMKSFQRLNPQIKANENFVNALWTEGQGICDVSARLTPAAMHDVLIGLVWSHALGGNDCLTEGAVHAACWYLKSTTVFRRGAEEEGTSTGVTVILPDATNWWLREMREKARAWTDFPVNGLPRVKLSRFHNDARLKTWSFMTWLLARYPEQWFEWIQKWEENVPFPEQVDEYAEKLLGRSLPEIEAEWRDWAAGRSGMASATGYGPPLLPEFPNDEQLKGLARVNEFRRLAGLPPCEIDQEATVGCKLHALYLQKYEDQWVWPEAHEEDPARDGFTPRGTRAGLRSVIVIGTNPGRSLDPTDSIDEWIGTVYHRFPLLTTRIRRIGFAVEGNVCVLDMGSLEEPQVIDTSETTTLSDMMLEWPPDGTTGVPRAFHADEHPDPLDDRPEGGGQDDFTAQRASGYPVSLQLAPHIAGQLDDSSITLYTCKKERGKYERDAVVPCYNHLPPKRPLLKRLEETGVVFAIPKEHLEPNTVYEVVVTFRVLAGEQPMSWRFKTGTRREGHGRLKIDKKIAVNPPSK